MCGISFYCCKKKHLFDELNRSIVTTSHRGPDSSGLKNEIIGRYNIGIGHNRLSIIDLSEGGNQPMKSDSGNILSYNGEIYNYRYLRQKLLNLGYKFIGESDSEVILKLFDEFGVSAFSMLQGMFSFVILDKDNERFYIVRDVVGIKPVYLFQKNGDLYGSSEIRGLKAFNAVDTSVDKNDVYEFFNNGFLYEPSTGFKYIKKLMPGHYCELNLSTGEIEFQRYKNINDYYETGPLSEKIEVAIKAQQVADVPLGIFFSGGTDSSILASYFKSTKLFFAKYEADPVADIDLKYSDQIATFLDKKLDIADLGSNDQDIESLLLSVDFVAKNTEELISDYTFWATYHLSKAAKDSGYKVMMSGMGGDEAFAGYPRYLVLKNHSLIKILSPVFRAVLRFGLFPKKLNKKFERLVSYCTEKEWVVAYSRMIGYFSRCELESLFSDYENLDLKFTSTLKTIESKYTGDKKDKVKLAQFMDLTGFLSHNLTISDKASMLASIELRVPLLDEAIVAHGMNASANQLIHGRETKLPLKDLLRKILPNKLVERPKTGFNPPLDGLIDKIGPEKLTRELSSLDDILNSSEILLLINNHFNKVANNTYKLWQLLYFSRWIKFNSDS
jgi:asparagine synthase (glutamine-hydrolysing)